MINYGGWEAELLNKFDAGIVVPAGPILTSSTALIAFLPTSFTLLTTLSTSTTARSPVIFVEEAGSLQCGHSKTRNFPRQ